MRKSPFCKGLFLVNGRVLNSANIFEAGNLVSPLYFYCKTAACGLNGDSSAYFSAIKLANA